MDIRETRRAIVSTALGLVGLAAAGREADAAAGTRCNTSEKCEAKCKDERAVCCNGECVLPCGGPDRVLNPTNCRCCRKDEHGRPTNSGCRRKKGCGA